MNAYPAEQTSGQAMATLVIQIVWVVVLATAQRRVRCSRFVTGGHR